MSSKRRHFPSVSVSCMNHYYTSPFCIYINNNFDNFNPIPRRNDLDQGYHVATHAKVITSASVYWHNYTFWDWRQEQIYYYLKLAKSCFATNGFWEINFIIFHFMHLVKGKTYIHPFFICAWKNSINVQPSSAILMKELITFTFEEQCLRNGGIFEHNWHDTPVVQIKIASYFILSKGSSNQIMPLYAIPLKF